MPFQKGHKFSPGRKAGSTTKIAANVKAVFIDAFSELQSDRLANLVVWARANPTEFYKLAARLIPHQAEVSISQLTTIIDISGQGFSADTETSGGDEDGGE